jgi:predicted O-methyltransferase YrrM
MAFIDKYKKQLGVRFSTFKKLFQIARDRNLKNIVETGTARGKNKFYYIKPRINWKDGMSTLLLAEYSKEVDGIFWSCDIDEKNIINAYNFAKELNYKINFAISDSIIFLRDLSLTIDILYLDSLDGDIPGANEHQLKEAKTSINKMNENGLILLDDKGSKTELSIPYFKSLGWETVLETNQQIILSR